MDMDLSSFEKEDFSINGFYRALVEDNVDPLEAGRVRVRILGIHPTDVLLAPTENLPWAEPVLPISYSGGANLQNIDIKTGVPAVPFTKYTPSPVIPPVSIQLPLPVPSDAVNEAATTLIGIPEHKDPSLCNSGTGGHFAVPAKGSLVWIFFDGGCHLRPQYFAMATQSRDWDAQKLKLTGDLTDRDAILTTTMAKFLPGIDPIPHSFTGKATSSAGSVQTNLKPKTPSPIGPLFKIQNRIENLTSWTTPGGTTILCNHAFGKEEFYILHKGFSHVIDSSGQVMKIVGTTNPAPVTPATSLTPTNSAGLANDETEINAGLKNVYVVGDYNLFVMGNCFIQCNQSVQINALANVGVVARNGNVNLLAEKGNINMEATLGSINMKAVNIQMEAENNILFKANNLIDLNALNAINLKSGVSILQESLSINNKATTNYSVNSDGLIELLSTGPSNYISKTILTVESASTNVHGKTNVLITAPAIESKADALYNVDSPAINIKGVNVNVNGDGVVNILGATLSAYGSATAQVGGGVAVIGGGVTTLTGLVTLGVGTVAPALPAIPVSTPFIEPEPLPVAPYVEMPFIPSTPDLPIIPTPSQIDI
jgi:hypothetical protein